MALPTPERIRNSEFFGVLAPGLYVVLAGCLSILVHQSATWGDLEGTLICLASWEPSWFAVVLGVGAAYLAGNVIRAFPVDWVDGPLGAARNPRGKLPPNTRAGRLYAQGFPYWPRLQFYQAIAKANSVNVPGLPPRPARDELPSPKKAARSLQTCWLWLGGRARWRWFRRCMRVQRAISAQGEWQHASFDFWKTYLRVASPGTTEFIETLEARTRLFCGMWWAGLFGGVVLLPGRSTMAGALAAVSFAIALLFGWRLRHIRGEEAHQVFLLLLLQRDGEPERSDARPRLRLPIRRRLQSSARTRR